MRIAIDVDDVIIDLVPSWLYEYNKLQGTRFTKEQMQHWDFERNGLNHMIYTDAFNTNVYKQAGEIEGAFNAINKLIQHGIEYVFVTAGVSLLPEKIRWMNEYGYISSGGKLDERLIVASNKSLIDADMIIDDKYETIMKWPRGKRSILFTQPWNASYELLPERGIRCDGWTQILDYFGVK